MSQISLTKYHVFSIKKISNYRPFGVISFNENLMSASLCLKHSLLPIYRQADFHFDSGLIQYRAFNIQKNKILTLLEVNETLTELSGFMWVSNNKTFPATSKQTQIEYITPSPTEKYALAFTANNRIVVLVKKQLECNYYGTY